MARRQARSGQDVAAHPFLQKARAQVAGGERIVEVRGGGFGISGDVTREQTRGRQREGARAALTEITQGVSGLEEVRRAVILPSIPPEPKEKAARFRRLGGFRRRRCAGIGGEGRRAPPGHDGAARGAQWPRRRRHVLRRRLGEACQRRNGGGARGRMKWRARARQRGPGGVLIHGVFDKGAGEPLVRRPSAAWGAAQWRGRSFRGGAGPEAGRSGGPRPGRGLVIFPFCQNPVHPNLQKQFCAFMGIFKNGATNFYNALASH